MHFIALPVNISCKIFWPTTEGELYFLDSNNNLYWIGHPHIYLSNTDYNKKSIIYRNAYALLIGLEELCPRGTSGYQMSVDDLEGIICTGISRGKASILNSSDDVISKLNSTALSFERRIILRLVNISNREGLDINNGVSFYGANTGARSLITDTGLDKISDDSLVSILSSKLRNELNRKKYRENKLDKEKYEVIKGQGDNKEKMKRTIYEAVKNIIIDFMHSTKIRDYVKQLIDILEKSNYQVIDDREPINDEDDIYGDSYKPTWSDIASGSHGSKSKDLSTSGSKALLYKSGYSSDLDINSDDENDKNLFTVTNIVLSRCEYPVEEELKLVTKSIGNTVRYNKVRMSAWGIEGESFYVGEEDGKIHISNTGGKYGVIYNDQIKLFKPPTAWTVKLSSSPLTVQRAVALDARDLKMLIDKLK